MEAFAAPLRILSRWAAVFVRHRELRLFHVVASHSLREAAVSVVMGQEFHADNQSLFLRFDHPVPESDDGWVWHERIESLREQHEERRTKMQKNGLELAPLAPVPSSSRPLATFAMQLLQLQGSLTDPLHGLTLVLAPAAVQSYSLEADVAALLARPELPWLRCMVIEPDVSTLGELPRRLGLEALQLGCVVDEELAKREFARKVDASMAADPAAPGLAQVGAAWPRGLCPPPRKKLPKPPAKKKVEAPRADPFASPDLFAATPLAPIALSGAVAVTSSVPPVEVPSGRVSMPGEPPMMARISSVEAGRVSAPPAMVGRASEPPPMMGRISTPEIGRMSAPPPMVGRISNPDGERGSLPPPMVTQGSDRPPPMMASLSAPPPSGPSPAPAMMGRVSMEPPPPIEDFDVDAAATSRPALAPAAPIAKQAAAPLPPPSIDGLTSASFRKVRPMTLKAAQAMREQRPLEAIQIQRRVVYACQDAKRPREALVMELLLATYVVHGGDRDKGGRIYLDVSDRAYDQTYYDLAVQALFAAAALRLLAKDHDGAAVLYGRAGAIGRDHEKPELGIEGFRMAGQLRAQNGDREQARRLFTEALSIGYGIPPGDAAQSSAPMAARQLAELCRRLGLTAQADSLERDAERLSRGEAPQGIREELG